MVAGLAMMAAVAASCAGVAEEPPTASPSPTESPTPTTVPEPTAVTIYYLIDFAGRMWLAPERHEVPKQARIGRAALEELVQGTPQDPDHVTRIPPDARILDLAIEDGLATVDWSADVLEANVGSEVEALGIQSIVWTLTEFPTVERVRFTVEGEDQGTASNGRVIEDWWGHVRLYDQPFRRCHRGPGADHHLDAGGWRPRRTDVPGGGRSIHLRGQRPDQDPRRERSARPDRGGHGDRGRARTRDFRIVITIQDPPTSPERWRLEAFEVNQETGEEFFAESREIRLGVAR